MRLIFFLFPLFFSALQNAHQDKWIVITTIQYPTEAVKKLAQLKDWHLVVVGDKKTPADWHLENCEYLSPQDQEKLNYKIIQYLPWNHYCRKNIGYLYAIEHGAKIIYDTDDDNYMNFDSIYYLPVNTQTACYKTDATTVNPYEYFGHPTVWPRGFPLSHITQQTSYELITKQCFIPVQQGVVNNDPDVDAIFRLTHFVEINFDATKKAVSLPKNVICPYNTQNTIIHYAAFWGLAVPISTAFRVCDIWRGYWVQRLLWDIGASLCFMPPTATQYRNEHNLIKDFEDEIDLYTKAENLVNTLLAWHSNAPTLRERIQDLIAQLTNQQFFKEKEIVFMNAWLEDLESIGFVFPEIF